MHEGLNLHLTVRRDIADILQRKLAREHDSLKAHLLKKEHAFQIVHGHLRARMQRQTGRRLTREPINAEILHERGVRPCLIEEAQVAGECRHLLIAYDGVDRHMHAHITAVGEGDRLAQSIFVKVIRIGACAEHIACQIDGVSAAFHSGRQRLPAPCRSQ